MAAHPRVKGLAEGLGEGWGPGDAWTACPREDTRLWSPFRSANRSCFCLLCRPGWEIPDTLDIGIADYSVLPNRTSSRIPPSSCPPRATLSPSTLSDDLTLAPSCQQLLIPAASSGRLRSTVPTLAYSCRQTSDRRREVVGAGTWVPSLSLPQTNPSPCLSLPCLYPRPAAVGFLSPRLGSSLLSGAWQELLGVCERETRRKQTRGRPERACQRLLAF